MIFLIQYCYVHRCTVGFDIEDGVSAASVRAWQVIAVDSYPDAEPSCKVLESKDL
jgi:hypothetical protein